MALWEILLFETADRLVDDGGGMNQINFLIENSHILKHIERLNFDSSSGNEKDLFLSKTCKYLSSIRSFEVIQHLFRYMVS